MNRQTRIAGVIRFGPFALDAAAGELCKHGLKIKLQGQPIDILAMLLERPGEVISREEIQKQLWPVNTNVEFEHSVNAAIKRLRDALDDDADAPRYIETLPKRGYRLIATIDHATPSASRRRPKWIWVASVAAFAAAALALLFALNVSGVRNRTSPTRKPVESLAVLPLTNLSDDPSQDYFVDGMTEALITELGKISSLRVISRQSMMQYKGTNKSAPQIARELNVEAVLEGSVLRAGDRVHISLKLISVAPERQLWANGYDRDLRDILALHSEIARVIAYAVSAKLTREEQQLLSAARVVDPEAYAAYLRGRYFLNRLGRVRDLNAALNSFQMAIARDPTYAPAYAGVATCYSIFANVTGPKDNFPKAKAAAVKALDLDSTLAEAHGALANIKMLSEWDLTGAGREFERAIELNSNSAAAHASYSNYLSIIGRLDESLAEARRAQQLEPLSIEASRTLRVAYVRARRFDEALEQAQATLDLDSTNMQSRVLLIWSYIFQKKYSEAFREYETLPDPRFPEQLAYLYSVSGRKRQAFDLLSDLETKSKRYIDPYDIAVAYAAIDQERAFRWLERAYRERSPQILEIKVSPKLDSLRSDPRFQNLLRRMDFPPDTSASTSLR